MQQCFLCGRDFASSFLPLHEQRCMRKWNTENGREAENSQDDAISQLSDEDWNKIAWHAAKYTTSPCKMCGGIFKPEELIAHFRICKSQKPLQPPWPSSSEPSTSFCKMNEPATVTWEVKDANGGENSMNKENLNSSKEPIKLEAGGDTFGGLNGFSKLNENMATIANDMMHEDNSENQNVTEESLDEMSEPTFPCYLCGQSFPESALCIHEMECFETRRTHNYSRPFEGDLYVLSEEEDVEDALDEIWETHLPQQRLCRKCGLLFFANSIGKHEILCVGAPTNIKPGKSE